MSVLLEVSQFDICASCSPCGESKCAVQYGDIMCEIIKSFETVSGCALLSCAWHMGCTNSTINQPRMAYLGAAAAPMSSI